MKYLPYEDFELHTKLSPDEIFYRLRAAVDTERKWWLFTNKPFWGEVCRGSFRIWRDTWWSRNFTPITFGIIQHEGLGSSIRIWMRMPWYSFLFYSFAFGYLWVLFFIGNAALIMQKIQTGVWPYESLGDGLLNFGLAIVPISFTYLLSVGTFKGDVRRVKERLLEIFETTEENIIYHDRILGLSESLIIRLIFLLTFLITLGWMVISLLK